VCLECFTVNYVTLLSCSVRYYTLYLVDGLILQTTEFPESISTIRTVSCRQSLNIFTSTTIVAEINFSHFTATLQFNELLVSNCELSIQISNYSLQTVRRLNTLLSTVSFHNGFSYLFGMAQWFHHGNGKQLIEFGPLSSKFQICEFVLHNVTE